MRTMGTPNRGDDLIASYSSKGPTGIDHILKPDVVAPGNVMTSLQIGATLEHTYPNNRQLFSSYQTGKTGYSDKYYVLSGTSMAAAVVSGGVADLLEAQPQLTPDQVKARLMKTAYKIFPFSSSHRPIHGHNLYGLLRCFHGRRRLPGPPSRTEQHRCGTQSNIRQIPRRLLRLSFTHRRFRL